MSLRNVVLTDHQQQLVETLVRSGRYQNASEVLREGLRLLEHREAENAARLKALREAARVGFDAIDHGDYKEFANSDELVDYLRELSEDIISKSAK